MARSLIAALETLGARVDLASALRTRDGKGDAEIQADLIAQANAQIPQIIAQGKAANWQAWITYHTYYKAPDLIGPSVAQSLGIPYLSIEATRARKRLGGAWDRFARAAEQACDAADVVFYLTERDSKALRDYAPPAQKHILLKPFLNRDDLPPRAEGSHLLAVGMMRAAAKLPSYQLIAETLALMPDDTRLEIAGDGPARALVELAMAPFADRVTFLGALSAQKLEQAYQRSGALIWPGVDEAFGLTYLEAQAHGLAVIAQDRPGVRDVLYPRDYPKVEEGAAGLAALAASPAPSPDDIRAHIRQYHLRPATAETLRLGLEMVGVK
ncbi:glycosyltransferase family 4 protein [Sulfitobacter donghicola]|uniref:Glycosyl transferase family 1 n=2 Tax=Sulfitobacter TaxID=60136 RepID=A0A073IJJ0_9RHOB|nr:glycosyltransferase family 4 protein [Sulfitobacter donghicola]KEJ89691.1 glycosyl transferase family 1 [Sulfitobacter donghicola DSW-25 = KCTC 12864 = JCM 14565]